MERETHTGAGSLAGLVTPGETHAAVPGGLHPTEGTHSGVVHEELKPVGRTQIGEVQGVCFWRDSTLEQGRSVRRKEAERYVNNSHALSPDPAGGEEREKLGVKLKLHREERGERNCSKI